MGITTKQRGRAVFSGGVNTTVLPYASDGAISVLDGIALLTKAGVGAYTLAAPARDGQRLTIIARTANAHVVTATGLIDDGITGGSKTTMTFTGGFVGESIELVSYGGKWNVVAKNVVAVT
jgi:hypothetical protein